MTTSGDAPEHVPRCSVDSERCLTQTGKRLNQTQRRGIHVFMIYTWIWPNLTNLPSVSCDALFSWRSHVVQICSFPLKRSALVSIISPPAGGARGGRYKFKETKSKKNRPCCGFFSNLYTKLIKQNVNMVKTTSQRRDGTKKTRKCIYWWKILPSFGGSARVTFRQIQNLAQGS